MLDSNLRNNSTSVTPNKYYNLRSEFQENGFSIRRTELKIAGSVLEGVDYEVMVDASKSSDILQDAVIKYQMPLRPFGQGWSGSRIFRPMKDSRHPRSCSRSSAARWAASSATTASAAVS